MTMRTQYCGSVSAKDLNKSITLCGWVHRRRDHGGLIFLDLRDREGLVQVVCGPEQAAVFETAQKLRNEFVIQVSGVVHKRPEGTINKSIVSGEVELIADKLNILNKSLPLPFNVDDYQEVGEEARLKYRYIDLRRPEVFNRFKKRIELVQFIRQFLEARGFMEVETPILTRSTPEGARDYLVPSRTHPGEFFALPQSPQIFKELLMAAGFDKYYQIVRCFRDEDLRADRQPEFTQLDLEMAFADEAVIQDLLENMIRDMFKAVLNVDFPKPFPRMTYQEAMSRYASDKPDLRIPLELVEISDLLKEVEFKVFSGPANDSGSRVAAMRLPKGGELSRKQIDDYTSFVAQFGAKGLAYIKVVDKKQGREGLQSPILKFLSDEIIAEILNRTKAQDNDLIFFGADKNKIVNDALGALRVKLGADLNLYTQKWAPLWVVDFPMFEQGDAGNWQALHHPFTSPSVLDPEKLMQDPGASISRGYDMVLNGYEIGGGSVRIHDLDLQYAVFKILGIEKEQADAEFPHLLNAMKYGFPPLAGLAFGIDRIAMLVAGCDSIREVIAFPKTQSAHCPLTDAPARVEEKQLKELHIKTTVKN